jgi:hypothetical protein
MDALVAQSMSMEYVMQLSKTVLFVEMVFLPPLLSNVMMELELQEMVVTLIASLKPMQFAMLERLHAPFAETEFTLLLQSNATMEA